MKSHHDRDDRRNVKRFRAKDVGLGWQWQRWRGRVLAGNLRTMDRFCVHCRATDGTWEQATELHHLIPRLVAPQYSLKRWNVTPLCRPHHELIHKGDPIMARHIHLDEVDLEDLNEGQTIQRGPVRLTSIEGFLGTQPTIWEPTPLELLDILDALLDGEMVQHGNCKIKVKAAEDPAMCAQVRAAVAQAHPQA